MVIRKISIGLDYKNAMHYYQGQPVVGGKYTIEYIEQVSENYYRIFVRGDDGVFQWKKIINMPVVEEADLNF
jgi:hypothetical protein